MSATGKPGKPRWRWWLAAGALLLAGYMTFTAVYTMALPRFVEVDCDLPHDRAVAELQPIAERLADEVSRLNKKFYTKKLEYLVDLSPDDQLYVFHTAMTRIGALFQGFEYEYFDNTYRTSDDKYYYEYMHFTYVISPYKIEPFFAKFFDPMVQIFWWGSISYDVQVNYTPETYYGDKVKRKGVFFKVASFMPDTSPFGFVGTIKSRRQSKKQYCPDTIEKILAEEEPYNARDINRRRR